MSKTNKYLSLALATVLFSACGGGSKSSQNDGKGSIDFAKYFPSESMSKAYIIRTRTLETPKTTFRTETIEVTGKTITTREKTKVIEEVNISDKNITITTYTDIDSKHAKTLVHSMYRKIDIGDKIFPQKINSTTTNSLGKITQNSTASCIVKSKEKKFEKGDYLYEGDLLKLECVAKGKVIYEIKQDILDAGVANDLNGSHDTYDKWYVYYKKGLGEVAVINDNCITNVKTPLIVNDNAKASECKSKPYSYEFYVEQ